MIGLAVDWKFTGNPTLPVAGTVAVHVREHPPPPVVQVLGIWMLVIVMSSTHHPVPAVLESLERLQRRMTFLLFQAERLAV